MTTPRFFLDQDASAHWYIIPVEKRAEWEKWSNLLEDDEAGWEAPDWTEAVGGSYTRVTFSEPEVE